MANGLMDNEEYSIGEYGPNTGVWRLLKMLDEEGVKGTFPSPAAQLQSAIPMRSKRSSPRDTRLLATAITTRWREL